MTWVVEFYSNELESEIKRMPEGFIARYVQYVARMECFGPDLGMPHTKAMGAGLFELRLVAREGIARVFYCTIVGRRIVFLHQFIKKTAKTPPRELEIARKRMKEVTHAK